MNDDRLPTDGPLTEIDLAATTPSRPWHSLSTAAVAATLDTDPERGLSVIEAADRLERHGPGNDRPSSRGGVCALPAASPVHRSPRGKGVAGDDCRGCAYFLLMEAYKIIAWRRQSSPT